LEATAGALLWAVVILFLTRPLSRAVRVVLHEELLPRMALPAGADNSVLTLVNYAVIGVGILLAAGAAGLGSTQLVVAFGALGVGIGLGLQDVVNNFVSGLILIFERPIKVGDRVETASHLGIVTRIGIRSSTVRTFDGAEVVVPNGDLISKEVINWTLSDQVRRVEVLVGVAYGSDPHRVVEVLEAVTAGNDKVLREPPPQVLMVGFGNSSLDFRLLVWVAIDDFLTVSSWMHLAVHDGLKDAGIEIPFPQRDLHLRSVDAGVAAGLRGGSGGEAGT
jgi:small-conductance mechanosensitive channel